MNNRIEILIFALLLTFVSTSALALSTDRDQPAEIEADDIEFDFTKGTKTYKENVLIVQGTLRIKADHLVTQDDANGELAEATATGSLARFRQRPDDKPDDVEGWAEKIVVDQANNILTLYGKAGLKQGADTAQGETIVYNMATDTLKVQGGAKVETAGADGQAPSGRRLEDPFKDDPIPTLPVASQSVEQQNESNNTEQDPAEPVDDTPAIAPTPSGRSRLIIQPK